MSSLRVEICNERFLPRFGVDRLLVLLARHLARSGHVVSFACLRCDRAMLLPITHDIKIIDVQPGLNVAGTEAAVLKAMAPHWEEHCPDIVVTGGWPFFESAASAAKFGAKTIFIDAGAVAQDALPSALLPIQLELRRIRQLALPLLDRILPISEFIRSSQTESDRGSALGTSTVVLGADHLALGITDSKQPGERRALAAPSLEGKQILLLGRFESHGYKNSAAAYELLRLVQQRVPEARLLILDAGEDCHVPPELASSIVLLGTPDDFKLQEIMQNSEAGISMSLWEGFNLPLAEMQWLGRPALAFNVGAHPEVIADPWLLSENITEMSAKLVTVLQGNTPLDLAPRFVAFRQRRPWELTLRAWEDQIVDLAAETQVEVRESPYPSQSRRIVLADITNASLDPANPGVIRVTRRLSSELQRHPALEVVFAAWNADSGGYILLDQTRRHFLEGFGGPRDGLGMLADRRRDLNVDQFMARLAVGRSQPPVLLMPEVLLDGHAAARINWARERGFKSAAVLYDLIPVFHKELCGANVTTGFPSYLDALTQTNAVWSISQFTLNEFSRYVAGIGRSVPRVHEAVILPGQFGDRPRNGTEPPVSSPETRILCVSTLEPRKNHPRLLKAFQSLRNRQPDLPLRLILVGNRYAGAPELAELVLSASKKDSSIEWCGIVDDERLAREFMNCAFTVYPSLIEGFGLPILESLWMGRPCLTHHGGVMQELAAGGGCLTVDMADIDAISRSLELMATDGTLRGKLREEAKHRKIATWQEYASEIAQRLVRL